MTNNFGDKQHVLNAEDGRKGGSRSTIAKKLANRTKCNCKCPVFNTCPLASIGVKYNICYANNKKYPTLRKNLIRLMEGDQKDFHDMVATLVGDMLRIAESEDDSSVRTKKIVVEAAEKLHNMKYGTRNKTEISGKISINDL